MKFTLLSVAAVAVALPGVATAQARSCAIPTTTPRVRPDLPSANAPKRILPIGGYTLAISWTPQYCRDKGDRPNSAFQCGQGNRFGFTLHGLWPDGVGKDWPQYCRATGIVPARVIRANLCVTPSAQLIQHEWAKHGTCMPGESPASFLTRSRTMYGRLRYPDIDALSRGPLTAGRLAAAMAGANKSLRPEMMRITATKTGWLDEIWICTDRRFRYARCPAHQGGLAPTAPVKIWRGAQ